jgi:uncharacterized protein YndB with AHSA1/START domain
MADVEASVEIAAPLADVWELYFDPRRWPSWVDGFSAITSSEGYPETGGELRWTSTPAGRGAVTERVLEHEPRRLHRVGFTDPGAEGELEVVFEMVPGGEADRRTKVTQRLSYRLRSAGPLGGITDRLFIRGQMRGSLERSLTDLRSEAEAAGATQSEVGR